MGHFCCGRGGDSKACDEHVPSFKRGFEHEPFLAVEKHHVLAHVSDDLNLG